MEDTLELTGYSVEVLPREKKTALYRHKDGRVVCLPSDAYSLRHYLSRGLVLYTGEEPVPSEPVIKRARKKTIKRR